MKRLPALGGFAVLVVLGGCTGTPAPESTPAPARYAPLFMRTDEGVVFVQDWAAGFLAAIRLRLEAWRPLLEAETSPLLLPILVHIPAPGIDSHIAELPVSARQHLAEAYHHLPTAVAALHDLRHRSAAERRTSPRRH